MTVRTSLTALAIVLASASAAGRQSSTSPGRSTSGYLAYGAGAEPCSAWTRQPERSSRRQATVIWVLGFVSGAGWSGPHDQRRTTADEVMREVSAFCRAHPELPVHRAAEQLVLSLEMP